MIINYLPYHPSTLPSLLAEAEGDMGSHPSDEAVDQLRLWHQNLHPIKLDIVGDFAGKELFAIHGESLVSHCVSKAQVDFGRKFLSSGQNLTPIYVCTC